MVTRKTRTWLEAWNFQNCFPPSRKRRGAKDLVNDGSRLHVEISVKIPEVQGLGASSLVNTSTCQESDTCQLRGNRRSCARNTSRPHLSVPLSDCSPVPSSYPLLYSNLVKIHKCFPDFSELSNKWSTPRRGMWGVAICSQVGQKLWVIGTYYCDWHLKWRRSVGLSPWPVEPLPTPISLILKS